MTGILNAVAVVATNVCGIDAFHAVCLGCADWRCHRQPHATEAAAIRCAQRHSDKHA